MNLLRLWDEVDLVNQINEKYSKQLDPIFFIIDSLCNEYQILIDNELERKLKLTDSLNQNGFTEFSTKHSQVLPLLENTIVFYEEKASVNPLKDMVIKKIMEENFRNPPRDKTGEDKVDKKVWKSFRRAINIEGIIGEIENDKKLSDLSDLILVIRDFVLEWELMPNGKWQPSGKKYFDGFSNISSSDPPVIHFKIEGEVDRNWKLENRQENLSTFVKNDQSFNFLRSQVISALKKKGYSELIKLFNSKIKPRLEKQLGIDETTNKIQYYFGSNKYGLLYSLISD